jgi:Domain of unknown function (DUF4936)
VSAGAAQVFVYYRVRAADAPAVIAAVRAQQDSLPGLACTLSRRVNEDVELVTLMETYAQAGGMSAAAQRDIEARMQGALAQWIVGERHIEVFVPCA